MSNKPLNNSGKIGVQSDNIFPIIKKFLYSDQEIFLRELVSNAVDATQKLKTLASKGDFKGELGDLTIHVKVDGDKLIISDRGVGMTAEEIDKYINQIAISGAEEFMAKYKDDAASIIGHFGLGFYSSFMVASKVEIHTQSYCDEEPSVHWSCEGSPEYRMEESAEKRDRGTDIVLHIEEEHKEFLDPVRIRTLLEKYCKFLPVPIVFGKKQEWKDGKYTDTDEDLVINQVEPAWTKNPTDLTDEDYLTFYRDLYPMSEDPLFWIHLNIDYPFNLTGILYFPKVKSNMDLTRNKVQLYSNQVFVTDSVEGIMPDFLTLLHGVLDSPDIPLNVSRSYLQADANVKKISSYITRKVADKLEQLFRDDRTLYEEKWEALDLFVKYGILSVEKFADRAESFLLLTNTEGKRFTLEEYRELIKAEQTDKEGKLVILYAVDPTHQYSYIRSARDKGYDVLHLHGYLDMPFVSTLEQRHSDLRFARVDSDTLDKLIPRDDASVEDRAEITEEEVRVAQAIFERALPKMDKVSLTVATSHQGKEQKPIVVVQNEFMRRMKDMSAFQQGMSFYGEFPDSLQLNLNLDSPLIRGIVEVFTATQSDDFKAIAADKQTHDQKLSALYSEEIKEDDAEGKARNKQEIDEANKQIETLQKQIDDYYQAFVDEHQVVSQLVDLALLSNGLLKGKELEDFVARSLTLISSADKQE